jgi:hypothetical protein
MTRESALTGAPQIAAAKRDQDHSIARAEALAFNLTAMAAGALPSTQRALDAVAALSHAVLWDLAS